MHYFFSFAFWALLTIFSAFAITFFTISCSLNFYLFHAAMINFIKGYFETNQFYFAFFGTSLSSTSSSKEVKDIAKTRFWRPSILYALLSILIVKLSFFRIGQNLVSMSYELKFIWIPSFIRMLLQGLFAESLPNLLSSGRFLNI